MNWDMLRTATIDEIIDWADSQPWCLEMSRCAQDREWHAEGDVWTHTRLVIGELPRLEDWGRLGPRERLILLLTSLFHDAGKPATSQLDPISGRITSPKHAAVGERLARAVLRELGCDLATREEIARMVRYHGRPPFLLEKPDPAVEVARLSTLVSNRLLYLFALADTRGRNTGDYGRPEENLHLWRMVAEENDCFDRPYEFASDHARFFFHRQECPNLHYEPHEQFRCTVTLLAGLPGAGKDTWARSSLGNLPMVSLDGLRDELEVDPCDDQGRVVQAARERCREHLRAGRPFCFNATNILRQTRNRWIDLFADYNARIEAVYIEPPFPTILEQNARRPRPVPEDVIRRLAGKCEPPTLAEVHGLRLVEDWTPARNA